MPYASVVKLQAIFPQPGSAKSAKVAGVTCSFHEMVGVQNTPTAPMTISRSGSIVSLAQPGSPRSSVKLSRSGVGGAGLRVTRRGRSRTKNDAASKEQTINDLKSLLASNEQEKTRLQDSEKSSRKAVRSSESSLQEKIRDNEKLANDLNVANKKIDNLKNNQANRPDDKPMAEPKKIPKEPKFKNEQEKVFDASAYWAEYGQPAKPFSIAQYINDNQDVDIVVEAINETLSDGVAIVTAKIPGGISFAIGTGPVFCQFSYVKANKEIKFSWSKSPSTNDDLPLARQRIREGVLRLKQGGETICYLYFYPGDKAISLTAKHEKGPIRGGHTEVGFKDERSKIYFENHYAGYVNRSLLRFPKSELVIEDASVRLGSSKRLVFRQRGTESASLSGEVDRENGKKKEDDSWSGTLSISESKQPESNNIVINLKQAGRTTIDPVPKRPEPLAPSASREQKDEYNQQLKLHNDNLPHFPVVPKTLPQLESITIMAKLPCGIKVPYLVVR